MTIYEQINNELYSPVKEVRTIETVTKELNNAKTVLINSSQRILNISHPEN